jgi:large subunit ribosomal protein L34
LWIHYYLFLRTSQRAHKQRKLSSCGLRGERIKNICGLAVRGFAFSKTYDIIEGMSFTYNPKKKKRKTTHGFLVRQASPTGRRVLSRRRAKGRKKLAV